MVEAKSLVLWGANDDILEPSTAEKFKETMRRADVHIIDNCGHVPHLEQPVLAAAAIMSFLDQ